MNGAAFALCRGDIENAKEQLDVLLERLDQKLIAIDNDIKHVIPSYIASILIYFFLLTKNFKMARHLTKFSRFAVDTSHLETTGIPNTLSQTKIRPTLLSTTKSFS
jgi:hypothetical protein